MEYVGSVTDLSVWKRIISKTRVSSDWQCESSGLHSLASSTGQYCSKSLNQDQTYRLQVASSSSANCMVKLQPLYVLFGQQL